MTDALMPEQMPDAPGIAYFRDGEMVWWQRMEIVEGTIPVRLPPGGPRRVVEFKVEVI